MNNYGNVVITTGGTYTIDSTAAIDHYFASPCPTTAVPVIATNDTNRNLMVQGDADFQGDVKIKGKSLLDTIKAIESRLAILQPDPKKLAKYEALQKAYDHYKLLEKLIGEDE